MKKIAFILCVLFLFTGCSFQEQPDQKPEETTQPVTAEDTIKQDIETEQTDSAETHKIGYAVTNNNTMILYMDGEEIQELSIEDSYFPDHAYMQDYDFDGYADLYIPVDYRVIFGEGTYYHFNTETNQFESWDALNSIGHEILVEPETQTLRFRNTDSQDCSEYFVYQWDNDNLSLIRHEISETGREFQIYSVDAQGNETLTDTVSRYEENDWRSAYLDVLHEYQQLGVYSSSSAFSLYDISGDGVPELIISDNYVYSAICRLYTFEDGLIDLGAVGADGRVQYCLDTNIIISPYASFGVMHDSCYQLENGKLTEKMQLVKNTLLTSYRIDSDEVTEDEYLTAYSHMITENCKTLGRDFTFNEALIESALTESKDWQQMYRNLLYGYMETEGEINGAGFSLFDVTGDGIPELFLGEDTSHVASCNIFGFQNGLVGYGAHGAYGEISYHPDENLFLDYDIHQGYEDKIYYTLNENGIFEEQIHFYNNMGAKPSEEYEFKVNGEVVSKQVYDETLSGYPVDGWKSLGHDCHFSESDIETALTNTNPPDSSR